MACLEPGKICSNSCMTRPRVCLRTITSWIRVLSKLMFKGRVITEDTETLCSLCLCGDTQLSFGKDNVRRLILAFFCLTAAVGPALGQSRSLADLIQAGNRKAALDKI